MGSFETSDQHANPLHRPLRVAVLKQEIYREVREMVADLEGWTLVAADDQRLELRCERKGGLLSGAARVTITVEGPDGIPSSTVRVRSESSAGLLSRDRANVVEFLGPFARRVG